MVTKKPRKPSTEPQKRRLRKPTDAGSTRRDLFMEVESKALLASARRARLFEHNTNKGAEAEDAIRRWLRAWLEPEYTISSGEIIDSVEPAGAPVARQQDGIIHLNSLEARRYTLPSGMRLVPIETVVATVEVKLTLTKEEFFEADAAAVELLDRQLSLCVKERNEDESYAAVPWLTDAQLVPLRDRRDRVTMAVFGYFGPRDLGTLRTWLKAARAIELVCCLDTGCLMRGDDTWEKKGAFCSVFEERQALKGFLDSLYLGIESYVREGLEFAFDTAAYRAAPRRDYDDAKHNTPA